MRPARAADRQLAGGFTLIELVTVLTLMGILAGIAAPSLNGMIAMHRVRATLDRVAVDLYYARAIAVREGRSVSVRFTEATDGSCSAESRFRPVAGYSILVDGTEAPAKRVSFGEEGSRVCVLSTNADADATITSRGVPTSFGRTLRARSGGASDSVVISITGRVLRFP